MWPLTPQVLKRIDECVWPGRAATVFCPVPRASGEHRGTGARFALARRLNPVGGPEGSMYAAAHQVAHYTCRCRALDRHPVVLARP